MTARKDLRIFLIAGEPSGDFLGAKLMAGLRKLAGENIAFAGIGGENMAAQGLRSLFPLADLAVMGFWEVVPRIPRILARLKYTLSEIERFAPDAVVTIDSWGFTGRIAKGLRAKGSRIPRIHYVAPMVWAWKEKRAHDLALRVDRLLCLLPNEPPYFEKVGLKAVHVGHPVLESGADHGDGPAFRARHGIPNDAKLLCLLPGSRMSEVTRLLPPLIQAAALVRAKHPDLHLAIPTVETVAETVKAASWPAPAVVVRGAVEKYDAFAASDAALAASGTVALELALAGLPSAIAYRASPATIWLARRLLKIRYANLVNLLLDRLAVPEYLQEDCTPENLADIALRLMDDGAMRAQQRADYTLALERLGRGDASPSLRAAREVLSAMGWTEEQRT